MSTSVASVVSFFPDAENGFQTTLASTISSGAATVPLNSVAGYTNGLPAVFVVDPSDPLKKQTFTGIIDTAGVQVTSVVWTAGTNQSHTAGSTVGDFATATHIAMMSKGITQQHSQAGAHTAVTATSVAATGDISSSAGKITTTAVSKLEDTGTPLSTYRANMTFDYVVSGGVWTADSVGVNLNASMTAIVCMINGRRISIGAVTARAFTTNVDTYIDILDNADGTGTLVYTTAATNAASAALAANSMRIGIIQAAATITATTKVNQGQEDKVFPIASSIPYAVTDSLGNLICPRDPSRKLLGYRQLIAGVTSTATNAWQDAVGLSSTIIAPGSRKVEISFFASTLTNAGATGIVAVAIDKDGTVVQQAFFNKASGNANMQCPMVWFDTPTAGTHTYKIRYAGDGGAATTIAAGAAGATVYTAGPALISIKLS